MKHLNESVFSESLFSDTDLVAEQAQTEQGGVCVCVC